MKSGKLYIHLLWMLLLTVTNVSSQQSFNPTGYASSFKEALKEPTEIYTVSVYYNRGLIFDVEKGKHSADADVENVATLKNLRTLRLNGCPLNFKQDKFFCNLGKVKQLEVLELRMSFKNLGLLTEQSIDCLKKLKSLKRINLPNQYPPEELKKLQLALPTCEIIINMYPEGE